MTILELSQKRKIEYEKGKGNWDKGILFFFWFIMKVTGEYIVERQEEQHEYWSQKNENYGC